MVEGVHYIVRSENVPEKCDPFFEAICEQIFSDLTLARNCQEIWKKQFGLVSIIYRVETKKVKV